MNIISKIHPGQIFESLAITHNVLSIEI